MIQGETAHLRISIVGRGKIVTYSLVLATTYLVQGNEHSDQELLVLGFEWEREAIDYASQDLQQLSNPIEVLRLVNKP